MDIIIYSSRWLIFPVYLGLSFGLLLLTIKFFQQILLILPELIHISESELVLILLSWIDIALIGGLLVMVMFSGYNNFISPMNRYKKSKDYLRWMRSMGVNSIKNKVSSSIVAISSVHLLRVFMESEKILNDKIMWFMIMHFVFLISAFSVFFLDTISKKK